MRSRNVTSCLLATTCCLLAISCSKPDPSAPEFVLARSVHPDFSFQITRGKLDEFRNQRAGNQSLSETDPSVLTKEQQALLREMATRHVVQQMVETSGQAETCRSRVEKRLVSMEERFPTLKMKEQFYEKSGMDRAALKDQLYFQVARDLLLESFQEEVQTSQKEASQPLSYLPTEWTKPESLEVIEIAALKREGKFTADRNWLIQQLQQVKSSLVAGESFSGMQRELTQGDTRGKLVMARRRLVKGKVLASQQKLFSLKEGGWSSMIETPAGLYFYLLEHKNEASVLTEEEAAQIYAERQRKRQVNSLVSQFQNRLARNAKLEYLLPLQH